MWNTLPSYIRDTTKSIESFKTLLRKHYKDLTDSVFNPDDPRTLKSVCVKCHTSRLYGTYYPDHVVRSIEPYIQYRSPIACAECNYHNAYEYYFILWFNSTHEYSILAVADGVRDREGSH